ncbi:MAG: hypothetical protein GQ550_05950, partial [Gammaproteobacteria bacterium]|nr:hypothetical protein [Gammaproteobacteria bacterium]
NKNDPKFFTDPKALSVKSHYISENSEIGLIINSTEIAQGMAKGFEDNINKLTFRLELKEDEDGDEQLLWHGYEDGSPVTFDVDPYTSFWRRLGVGFMSLLPIESQL